MEELKNGEVVETDDIKIAISQVPGVVTTNFEVVKSAIVRKTEQYKNVKVTELNKAKRKKEIANLRKDIKLLNDKRIEVKNECLKPYLAFDEKVKELIDIYNVPINIIDNQVKELEESQRLEKKAEIANIYNSLIGDLIDNVPLAAIYDTKWENAATSIKSIKEDITAKIDKINQDVFVINSSISDKKEDALQMYYENLNLADAIAFINRYEQQKRVIQTRLEEQQRREKERELDAERERIRREERAKIAQEEQIKADAYKKAQEEQRAKEQAEIEAMAVQKQVNASTINTVTYSVSATPEELEQIEMYLSSIGVDYERVI
jgi:hypothetical protein